MIIWGTFIDLTGNRYGKLTVLKRIGTKNNSPLWKCVCDCNNYKDVTSRDFKSGNTNSCGCLHLDKLINYKLKSQNGSVSGVCVCVSVCLK